MELRGKAWKFGDNISTDEIIPTRYAYLRGNFAEYVKHVLEDVDLTFARACLGGSEKHLVIAGKNFGRGSAREYAPLMIKLAGVQAIAARSFARIFYRNCFNIGLPAITADTNSIRHGDLVQIDLGKGTVIDLTQNQSVMCDPIPRVFLRILDEGGLIEFVRKHGDLTLTPT